MKTDNLEKILCSIDKKTLGSVIDEREKRFKKLDIIMNDIEGGEGNAEEFVPEKETRGEKIKRIIFKTVSIAAAVALIAGIIYVVRLPLYMSGKVPTPAAGTEETKDTANALSTSPDEPYPERVEDYLKSWTDPDRTDKISMEDAAKIKEGMTLREAVDLIGKPVGSIDDSFLGLKFLGLKMEWEIDNGAALHVSIGSTASYVQNLESIGNFKVISCEIKHGPAVIYTPDYSSTSTLHADVFLEKLKNEGYHKGGGMDTSYNVEGIIAVYNITPAAILSEEPDLELFYVKDGYHCFMMYKGEIYRFETFGGYHHRLVLWDYDGNGVKDLCAYDSWGSGMLFLGVDVFDLTTMKCHAVISRNVLLEPGFSFDFDGDNVYIDGEILTYSDGEFHCGDMF